MPIIDPELALARTPPPSWYTDPELQERLVRHALAPGWHLVADARGDANLVPFDLAGQPALWVRADDGTERILSNVCTHRSAVMVDAPCVARAIRCPYHGRRFRLDGAVAAAPGFDVPPDDPLPTFALAKLGPWRFASLAPSLPFAEWFAPVLARLPWDELVHEPAADRDFAIEAPWTIYVENYLEGLHIPFVHPELARELALDGYTNELFAHGTLQTGLPKGGEATVPGTGAAALYFWLWPSTMVNVYPWGVSLNGVQATDAGRCTVRFRSWVADRSHFGQGAGGALDLVEQQDQEVIARVWRGLQAPVAVRGTYSPSHEAGTHAFHRRLEAALFTGGER